jgi:DNA-binding NarL/FixJ family response regulator
VSPKKHKIFLVDDHPLVREGLASLIHQQPDLVVCGHAGTWAETLTAIIKLEPDLLIVDLQLPGTSGIELIKTIKKLHPNVLMIVLSMHDEKLYAERAVRAGAQGYVMKRETSSRLIAAMYQVLEGKLAISGEAALSFMAKFAGNRAPAGESPTALLSDRELEVFRMLGEGSDTRKIADTLNISIKTVQAYCARIKDKLTLNNATELLREAVLWNENQT